MQQFLLCWPTKLPKANGTAVLCAAVPLCTIKRQLQPKPDIHFE